MFLQTVGYMYIGAGLPIPKRRMYGSGTAFANELRNNTRWCAFIITRQLRCAVEKIFLMPKI